MNRHHNVEMIEAGLAALRQVGIHNLSIDLIYGLPHQSLATWKSNLEQALALNTEHISLYALTIEENSQFGRDQVQPAPSELEEAMYFYAVDRLAQAGFERYEISNFTKGRRSQHNLHYWRMDDYIGLGPGAVSYVNHQRIENTAKMTHYFTGDFHARIQDLSPHEEQFECIMMGLRVKEGVSKSEFKARFNLELSQRYPLAIEQARARGWLEMDDQQLWCTADGLGLLHDVLLLFMDEPLA